MIRFVLQYEHATPGLMMTIVDWVLFYPALILAIAAILDFVIGDPWHWLHPVQVMGWFIQRYTQYVLHHLKNRWQLKLAGIVLGVCIVIGSGLSGWIIVAIAQQVHPIFGIAIASILLASCFAGRSLRDAANDVLVPLRAGDIESSRKRLSLYVGRDTEDLDEAGIYRAVFETITENAVDGVMAPLFYGVIGALLSAGTVPLAIAYKASSTLDSMVGYHSPPYTDLGFFSAKLDDVLTWIPCRLVVLTIGLISGKPKHVWMICRRDAPKDPSPNAGWSECVYAAALNVQVGGTNVYQGIVKHKPALGEAIEKITDQKVREAFHLTRIAFLIWLGIGIFLCRFSRPI